MGRLIDAEALKKDILSQSILGETMGKVLDRYIHVVDSQPTVFDVDKVVEQLEDYANEEMHYYKGIPYEKCIEECIGKAIEIVKGGGNADLLMDRAKSKSGERIPYDGKWK